TPVDGVEECVKHDRHAQRQHRKGRYTEPREQLESRLRDEHAPEGGNIGGDCGAHATASFSASAVNARKTSSRSAPATTRSWMSRPRRNSSRSSVSGALLNRRTRSLSTSRREYRRPVRSPSLNGCVVVKLTRLPTTLDLISAGVASATTTPRSMTITRSAS